jgi:PAS domain S-box-containing protein
MKSPRILLVEDERIVALDVQARLQRLGYSVLGIVSTGEEALKAATEGQPDLALVDVRLKGGMDGIEVARHFRERLSVPVIFLTAYADAATVERAKRTEPFGYLIKPFDEKELLTAVELALHNSGIELKLRESEEHYRDLFENASDVIFSLDMAGNFLSVNKAAERVTGYSREVLLQSNIVSLLAPAQKTLVEELILEPAGGSGPISCEVEFFTKDGGTAVLEVSTRLQFKDGMPSSVQAIARDITERKYAEKRLAEQAEELARSNAELEHFAYVASHDLQEPLRMVSSYVRLLARRYRGRLDADADEFIGYALDGTNRMQQFIKDLLAYSRVSTQKEKFEQVDCELVLAEILRNLAPRIEQSGAIVTHDPLPSVAGDATQLLQLFQNLAGNAIKFHGADPPRVHIGAARQGAEWVFSVRDNGIGVHPKDTERIFMIFERAHTDRSYPGTGIGLAISKRIVERHHGRIWVDSRPGSGSTFFFTVPAGGGDGK